MAKIVATKVLIAAVNTGKPADVYPVFAYLRDTSIPDVRPLYSPMNDHFDDGCKAAALVRHRTESGRDIYELIIQYGHLETRYRASVGRQAPTLEEFTKHITGE